PETHRPKRPFSIPFQSSSWLFRSPSPHRELCWYRGRLPYAVHWHLFPETECPSVCLISSSPLQQNIDEQVTFRSLTSRGEARGNLRTFQTLTLLVQHNEVQRPVPRHRIVDDAVVQAVAPLCQFLVIGR